MARLRTVVSGVLVATMLGTTAGIGAAQASEPEPAGVGAGYVALRGDTSDDDDPADKDADGLRATRRNVVLGDLGATRSVEVHAEADTHEHEHEDQGTQVVRTRTGVVVDVPEQPEMIILDELATGTEVAVRSQADGTWSEWTHLIASDDDRPDGGPGQEGGEPDGTTGIGPVWLGHGVEQVEVVSLGGDEDFILESLEALDTPSASVSEGPQGVRAAAAAASDFIRPRSDWATAEMKWASSNSGCGSGPSTRSVTGMIVHHTAGGNSYSPDDVQNIMRGVWRYHVRTQGWCDVAYNFFVDRFGQVWEGRQGGITKAVTGGHTYGFNTYTSGVAQLGHFDQVGAPAGMTAATSRLVGWKLGIHGIDPSGRTTYVNSASGPARDGTPPGGKKTLSSVVGHRDLGSTSCPGSSTYAQLPRIRSDARTGAHVLRLFRSFLGRSPSRESYRDWAAYAQANGLLAAADQLSKSEEYAGIVIRDAYRSVLGREPDRNGMSYWLGKLRAGMPVSGMLVYFYGSSEYYQQTGGGGRFIDALYRELLHRPADANGKDYWLGQLYAGATPATVAAAFIDSIESRRDRVTALYQRFLKRNPDDGGREYWAGILLQRGDLALAMHLALTDEYYDRFYD